MARRSPLPWQRQASPGSAAAMEKMALAWMPLCELRYVCAHAPAAARGGNALSTELHLAARSRHC